jgi:hypothetical protein
MDPRVKISTASLEKKFDLEVRMATLLSETSKAAMQAGSIREPLQKLSQQASGATRDSVQAFQNKLAEILGPQVVSTAKPSPDAITLTRVNGQVIALYGQVWQVDAEPTVAQSEASVVVVRDASDVMKRWETFKNKDLPAFNIQLHGANLPELKVESDSHKEEGGMDEE